MIEAANTQAKPRVPQGINPASHIIVAYVEYVRGVSPEKGPARSALLEADAVKERRFEAWELALEYHKNEASKREPASVTKERNNGHDKEVGGTASFIRKKMEKALLPEETLRQLELKAERALGQAGLVVEGDAGMKDAWDRIRKVSDNDGQLLVRGETGTGKELVAKAVHYLRNTDERKGVPFFAINCAAINEGIIESELFGHVKGAFTHAITDREGAFEAVKNGGTLLLDEIGDMPLGQQATLLRVLESRTFSRMGESKSQELKHTKIIASTNQDLEALVEQKKFRKDLLHRLRQNEVMIPSLEERNSEHRQRLIGKRLASLGKNDAKAYMTQEALDVFLEAQYEGNVRDLFNHVDAAWSDARFDTEGDVVIDEQNANRTLRLARTDLSKNANIVEIDIGEKSLSQILMETKIRIITMMMRRHPKIGVVAKKLGLERSNLYRLMRQLGMDEESKDTGTENP